MFRDRCDAGRQLAERLRPLAAERPILLGLPRGGVPVAFEVARLLRAPLDVVVVRKIGHPLQPELAVGALVDGDHPEAVLDEARMRRMGLTRADVAETIAKETAELRRRERLYRGGRPAPQLHDRLVVLIDDGIATGASVHAALRALRRQKPARIVLAAPVAPPGSVATLRHEADEVLVLEQPPWFEAVGQFYEHFGQTSDDEVIDLLAQARAFEPVATG